MPRLRQVPRSEVHAGGRPIYDMLFGDRCPVAEPGTATGSPGNWWTVFAVVPDCFDHAVQGFAFYRSPQRKLDPKLRELGQLRAGYGRGSRFVFSHVDERITAVPAPGGSAQATDVMGMVDAKK